MTHDTHNQQPENPDDLKLEQETGEVNELDHPRPSGLSGVEHEQQIVQDSLSSAFDAFDVRSYLENFYPEMDVGLGTKIIDLLDEIIIQTDTGKNTICLPDIMARLSDATEKIPEHFFESLENYCIYHFFLKTVVPTLLKHRPDDHLRVMDVGGGPTIYQDIPLLGIVDSIAHLEFMPENRREVERWKENKNGGASISWQSYFALVEQYRRDHPEMYAAAEPAVQKILNEITAAGTASAEDLLKKKITQIVPTDVFQPDLQLRTPGDPDVVAISRVGSAGLYTGNFGLAEVVTSNFCIESATGDPEEWKKGLTNVASAVPYGGFLVMTAIRNATWYQVGNERMPAVSVDADTLAAEITKNNLTILSLTELTGSDKDVVGYDGMVFVMARRE